MKISGKKSFILILVASILLFFLSYLIGNAIFQNKSYNFMVKYTSNDNIASDDVILVVIDDKSLTELGRWPWKRDRTIQIFDYLEYYTDAKVIAYDAVVMAPDFENPESDRYFFNNVGKYNKLIAGVGFMSENFGDNINEAEYNALLTEKNNIKVIDKRRKKQNKENFYKSFTPFLKEYFKNIKLLGSVNTYQDQDGYIRRIDQLVDYNGSLYPSLGLISYSKYTGINEFTIDDEYITAKNDKYKLKIPVKSDSGIVFSYISFYKTLDGMYSHKKVSASDVIKSFESIKKGEKPILDPAIFKDKAVFVGANANAQALFDIKRTPISDTFAGVDIQATNFNNLIDNVFYTTSSPYYDFAIVLFAFLFYF